MTSSESKGRFFYKTNRFESIHITNRIDSNRELECSWQQYFAAVGVSTPTGVCKLHQEIVAALHIVGNLVVKDAI